jgi:AcrR family transcriptional regulator
VARAKREEETRQRITEAAVQLHGTLGPANTTITDVAKRAGVGRMTVYNHFPSEVDLFVACSTHWASLNPFPDPSHWAKFDDVRKRLAGALHELYGWYGLKQGMLGNVFRDTPAVPSLAEVMEELWSPYVEQMIEALERGWPVEKEDSENLRATLRLVVDFDTWQLLTRFGLDDERSAKLAVRFVVATFPPKTPA